jgi:hypothetical protein
MTRKLIRADGTTQDFDAPLSFGEIHTLIHAASIDSVLLRDRVHVMILDDNGYETKPIEKKLPDGTMFIELVCVRALKPFNDEATRLYHEVCVPGTTHEIVGDVFICPDADFA